MVIDRAHQDAHGAPPLTLTEVRTAFEVFHMEKTPTSSQSPSLNTSQTRTNSPPQEGLTAELQSISQRDFLQNSALGLIEVLAKYKSAVGAVVVLLIVGFLGWTGYNALQARTELKAQNALHALEKQYSEKKEKFDQARFADLVGQKQDGLIKPTGDLANDYGSLIDELEAFAKTHAGTTAGAQAAIMASEALISYNQADRASQALGAASKDTKTSSLIGALTRMASGNTLAAAGKCDQAIKVWEEILATKAAGFLHGEAALRAGLCLEKTGDKARATEMYRKASSESDRSSTAQTAKALLRAIEMGG